MNDADITESHTGPRGEEISSDLVDLSGVSITEARGLAPAARAGRLLEEVRRLRSSAIGDPNPPAARAE